MPKVEKEKVTIVQQPSGIESIRISKKGAPPQYIPFTPKELSLSAKKAFQTSLTMLMGHIADFHMVALTTLSKKYGHSIDEMVQTVMESPECKSITLHPVLRDLSSNISETDIPKELQKHPEGNFIDKTQTPFYYEVMDEDDEAVAAAAVAITAKSESPKSSKSKPESKKAVTATATTTKSTAKKAVKKSIVDAAFESSDDSDSDSNSDSNSDTEIIIKNGRAHV
jgi:hypothetical protein